MLRNPSTVALPARILMIILFLFVSLGFPFFSPVDSSADEYRYWSDVGHEAALEAAQMIRSQGTWFASSSCIVLTNAGHAMIDGRETTAALDGITRTLRVSRGAKNLVEIHSSMDSALWFAAYHTNTGYCAYLEIDPDAVGTGNRVTASERNRLFAVKSLERIDSEYLFANSEEAIEAITAKPFNGNEFRIITIANAVAADAPSYALRSFEFHDHYCPGVTSGILMCLFIQNNLPFSSASSYFVHTVQPWCKEDAFLVMLNATPGKKKYAISYSTDEDIETWATEVSNASTIIYLQDSETSLWTGYVLGYTGGDTGCPTTGNSTIDKLCSDLWYLERMDQPEEFISVLATVTLPEEAAPKDYARPGADPMALLGLTQ